MEGGVLLFLGRGGLVEMSFLSFLPFLKRTCLVVYTSFSTVSTRVCEWLQLLVFSVFACSKLCVLLGLFGFGWFFEWIDGVYVEKG